MIKKLTSFLLVFAMLICVAPSVVHAECVYPWDHIFNEDSICTVCGYTCEHEYFDGICSWCYQKCGHIYSNDGICEICNYEARITGSYFVDDRLKLPCRQYKNGEVLEEYCPLCHADTHVVGLREGTISRPPTLYSVCYYCETRIETYLEHDVDYRLHLVYAPNCHETGSGINIGYCKSCNLELTYEEIELAMTPHNYKVNYYNDSTCSESGSVIYQCADCYEFLTETLELKDHTYGKGNKCTICGVKKGTTTSTPQKPIKPSKPKKNK